MDEHATTRFPLPTREEDPRFWAARARRTPELIAWLRAEADRLRAEAEPIEFPPLDQDKVAEFRRWLETEHPLLAQLAARRQPSEQPRQPEVNG